MKNHYLISPLILTTLVLLATGCQKEKLDYPEGGWCDFQSIYP